MPLYLWHRHASSGVDVETRGQSFRRLRLAAPSCKQQSTLVRCSRAQEDGRQHRRTMLDLLGTGKALWRVSRSRSLRRLRLQRVRRPHSTEQASDSQPLRLLLSRYVPFGCLCKKQPQSSLEEIRPLEAPLFKVHINPS